MAKFLTKRREKDIELTSYQDRFYDGGREAYERDLKNSATLYVGNLSFYTTEEQVYELFGRVGDVKRVIMGLNKESKMPCGFCFVEYHTREDARNAMRYINQTRLDDRLIRTDWDPGFKAGRQFGRGRTGGQVRDDFRMDFDEGRGGFGGQMSKTIDRIVKPDFSARKDTDRAPRRQSNPNNSSAKEEGEEPDTKKRRTIEAEEDDND